MLAATLYSQISFISNVFAISINYDKSNKKRQDYVYKKRSREVL